MKARIMNRVVEVSDERVRAVSSKRSRTSAHTKGVGSCMPSPVKASPSPLPGWPKPTDKWNYAFAQFMEREKQAGRIKHWYFEPFSLWLPGEVRYKPDFLIQYPDGLERKLEFVEIKGYSKNLRDGITRYKIAAAMFPCFTWKMVKRVGHGWQDY